MNIHEFSAHFANATREVQKVLLGQEEIVEQVLIAMLARAQGLAVSDTFGLAPSTATWQSAQANTGTVEDQACAR